MKEICMHLQAPALDPVPKLVQIDDEIDTAYDSGKSSKSVAVAGGSGAGAGAGADNDDLLFKQPLRIRIRQDPANIGSPTDPSSYNCSESCVSLTDSTSDSDLHTAGGYRPVCSGSAEPTSTACTLATSPDTAAVCRIRDSGGDDDVDEECVTPTASQHLIPEPTVCPPAPKKPCTTRRRQFIRPPPSHNSGSRSVKRCIDFNAVAATSPPPANFFIPSASDLQSSPDCIKSLFAAN